MEDTAGWKVIINVPQPNGKDGQHFWVAAISDEEEVRERLLLRQIPCEAQLEPLSVHELRQLGVDPGEVRCVLATTAATPTVETTGHSTRQVNDDMRVSHQPSSVVQGVNRAKQPSRRSSRRR